MNNAEMRFNSHVVRITIQSNQSVHLESNVRSLIRVSGAIAFVLFEIFLVILANIPEFLCRFDLT